MTNSYPQSSQEILEWLKRCQSAMNDQRRSEHIKKAEMLLDYTIENMQKHDNAIVDMLKRHSSIFQTKENIEQRDNNESTHNN